MASAAKHCVPSSTSACPAITSTTVASITYSDMQDTFASSDRAAVDCMMCGSPGIVSVLPAFCYVSDDRPLPLQVQAARVERGAGDEDDDGPLELRHMLARPQDVRGGSAGMLA